MAWLKRLAAPLALERKAKRFIVAPRGPHSLKNSISLAVVLREYLKVAETYKEAKKIVKEGKIIVDGKACKDHKFGLGIMDIIHIPAIKKSFRMLPAKHGLKIIEIPEREKNLKLCKITGKKVVRGGKVQLSLHDGRTIIADNSYHTQGSVLIELPKQKIMEYLKLGDGMSVLIVSGKNKTKIAKISKMEEKRLWLEEDGNKFEAPISAVMTVGKDKPLLTM